MIMFRNIWDKIGWQKSCDSFPPAKYFPYYSTLCKYDRNQLSFDLAPTFKSRLVAEERHPFTLTMTNVRYYVYGGRFALQRMFGTGRNWQRLPPSGTHDVLGIRYIDTLTDK